MTSEQLDALERLARAATPGKWTWEDDPPTLYAGRTPMDWFAGKPMMSHGLNLLGRLEPDWNGKANLDYIAAMNPETTLALIARVRELEGALNWLVHLGCGVGKAGGEPQDGEWEAAMEAGQVALTSKGQDDE